MKRLLILMLLSGCATYTPQAQSIATNTEYPSLVPTIAPTFTPIPSATIDYEQTAAVAQSTADEARRVNAKATTEYLALLNQQYAMTAEQDRREFDIIMLTATMAGTSIPLTQTQQAAANTQTAKQQAIISGQMTATKEAPLLAEAMIDATNKRQYGATEHVAQIVATWAIVIFIVIFAAWLYYRWDQEERQLRILEVQEQPEPEPAKETVLHMRVDKRGGDFSQTRFVIPCTSEQLTEFAEAITQGNKTMAINQWEGKETLFTRPVILQVRAWARSNDFATPTEDNQLAPTNDFLDFLCRWLDNDKLPAEYEFEQVENNATQKQEMQHAY